MVLPLVASSWTSAYWEEEFPMDDISHEMSVELRELRLRVMLSTPNTSRPTRFQTLSLNDIVALLSSNRHKTFIFYSEQATAETALGTSSNTTERSGSSAVSEDETSLANGRCREPPTASRNPPLALQTWRLRRVQEYVRSHISDTIRLTDLANAAGLTRMYFAAQFRARTGVRPHDYVIRQRIAHAQALLMVPQTKISDVGFCVGFANQAHFTTVFRRYTGITPHRWRLSQSPEDWVSSMKTSRSRADMPLSQPHCASSEHHRSRAEHTTSD
jgi:AraC-like DNA-binding protein